MGTSPVSGVMYFPRAGAYQMHYQAVLHVSHTVELVSDGQPCFASDSHFPSAEAAAAIPTLQEVPPQL